MTLQFRHLLTLKIEVNGPQQLIGALPHGYTRRIMSATGGAFEGERLRGRIVPGGGDTVLERPDGGLHLDVRLTLETDAGEMIYMTYAGRRNGPPEMMEKIVRREPIERGTDYFRVVVQFETGAPRLRWLNDILAVGTGYRDPDGPGYDIFEIL